MTSGIWTTAGICAPCGKPPGDVYHDSIGGTRNEATDAPTNAPASMRMSAVFTIPDQYNEAWPTSRFAMPALQRDMAELALLK